MDRFILIALLAISSAALAQQPVADQAGKAATRLSKDEIHQLLSGANTSSVNAAGNPYTMEYRTDGSISGHVYSKGKVNSREKTTGMAGKWRLSENGQVCLDYNVMGRETTNHKYCRFVLREGNGRLLFSKSAESGDDAVAFEVKK